MFDPLAWVTEMEAQGSVFQLLPGPDNEEKWRVHWSLPHPYNHEKYCTLLAPVSDGEARHVNLKAVLDLVVARYTAAGALPDCTFVAAEWLAAMEADGYRFELAPDTTGNGWMLGRAEPENPKPDGPNYFLHSLGMVKDNLRAIFDEMEARYQRAGTWDALEAMREQWRHEVATNPRYAKNWKPAADMGAA